MRKMYFIIQVWCTTMPRLAVRGLSARCVLGHIIDCHSEQLVLNSLGLKVPVFCLDC